MCVSFLKVQSTALATTMDCKHAIHPDHSSSLKILAINIFLVTEYSDIYLMEFSEVPNWLLPIDVKGKQVLLEHYPSARSFYY